MLPPCQLFLDLFLIYQSDIFCFGLIFSPDTIISLDRLLKLRSYLLRLRFQVVIQSAILIDASI